MPARPLNALLDFHPTPTKRVIENPYIFGGGGGGGAISVLSNAIFAGNSTGSIDTTGADCLIVTVGFAFGAVSGVSDNKGNTFVPLTQYDYGGWHICSFYALGANCGAGHTITASATGFNGLAVITASGVGSFQTESGSSSPSSGSIQPGSVTPITDGSLIVSTLWNQGTSAESLGGFTSINGTVDSGFRMGLGHLVQSTAANVNPSWTWSGGADGVASIAVFNP